MRHPFAVIAAVALLGLAACSPNPPAGPGYGPMSPMGMGYGMGPGGMGYAMGPGGMGYGMGMGGYGMGPGGPATFGRLPADLSTTQREQLRGIERDLRTQQWDVMQKMHALMWADGRAESGVFDEQAMRGNYEAVAALHRQMFENMVAARKKADAVLTPQQREQARRGVPQR